MGLRQADLAKYFGVSASRIKQLRDDGTLEGGHGDISEVSIRKEGLRRGFTHQQMSAWFEKSEAETPVVLSDGPTVQMPADRDTALLTALKGFNALKEEYGQLQEAYQSATARVKELDGRVAELATKVEELERDLEAATAPRSQYSPEELAEAEKSGLFRIAS